jgi:hypothetical protein
MTLAYTCCSRRISFLSDTTENNKIQIITYTETRNSLCFLRKICGFHGRDYQDYAVFWNVTPCGSCKNRRLVTRFRIRNVFTNNPALPFYRRLGPSFVLWPFTTHATIPFPQHPSASSFLNSILASFLTWYFFAACVGC